MSLVLPTMRMTNRRRTVGGGIAAVTGDILAVSIDPDGWTASVTVKGVGTGGTYDFGLGANNTTSVATKLKFTVVSLGFDDTGAATTITRTVWGVKQLRKAYPNEATNDETVSGSDVIVRIVLSDYIWAKDKSGAGNSGTDVLVEILSGFYTQGTASRAATATVTNNSTAAYPKVVGNWSWPGYALLQSGTHTLRSVAFHRDGQSARPVRAVKFTITDGTNSATQTVTTPVVDTTMPDEVPVVEYVATLDVSGLTDQVEVTCDFIAYPWVGDAASCLDTSTGTVAPTPLVGPIKGFTSAVTDNYGITMALVDTATGVDATGQVYDSDVYDPVTVARFLTIGKAAAAIAAYNNTNRSRNDVGGGIIELEVGNYAWLGSSNTYGNLPKTWITIRPKTGVARADVVINAASGNTDISDRIKLENLTITVASVNTFLNIGALWLHGCDINSTGTALINVNVGAAVVWVTHGKVTAFNQGLRPNATQNIPFSLVRGNDLSTFQHTTLCYTVLGNRRTGRSTPSNSMWITEVTGLLAPQPVNFIIAFNAMYGWESFPMLQFGSPSFPNTVGGAVVQNLLEFCNGTGEQGGFASNDLVAGNTPYDNVIMWHNTFVGQRQLFGYNYEGSVSKLRRYWSVKNNYWDRTGFKTDNYPAGPPNAARVGNWPIMFQVGATGNCHEQNMISVPSSFFAEFAGISSYQPAAIGTLTHPDFVARASYDGTSAGAGDGDYHVNAGSILETLPIDALLPKDLDNVSRTGANTAGVYA